MMPDDLTKPLSEKQLRDLFAYLKHAGQVPLLASKENWRRSSSTARIWRAGTAT